MTWNPWRDHMILEYEIMKFDGDLGRPTFCRCLRISVRTRLGACLKCSCLSAVTKTRVALGVPRRQAVRARSH